ncbi:phytoene desaturase family protein [Melittangium boletus]|uniref:FAD-dependent oxidoreductase n=1 Tax=Melittangium boletus DSM 14713 TaxID=1294270 RepID=A0A250IGF2_9BACT|nr:FAD-dependent oxidoreductase [Melittangium boletus]ATB30231.1 FAD-dependent oxidoreductase [Melittangium boletus DSM 14713]
MTGPWYDAVVVGAGFGGLGAALELTRRGARVALCETLNYPGGCASTFHRHGHAFESGATLFSGLADGQLFGRWVRELGLDVTVDWVDPLVELRTPGMRLVVYHDRDRLLDQLRAFPGAPARALGDFFALQRRVADALWPLFDDPTLLPPLDVRALLHHASRAGSYLPLARWMGRPLGAVLEHLGLLGFTPLRTYLDALCQITVQCAAAEAEAPFALAAMDYYWRGTGHVRGGIGQLARALAGAVTAEGGDVLLANRVKSLTPTSGGWRVESRRGELLTRHVVANVLPQGLARLLSPTASKQLPHRVRSLAGKVAEGWGAVMLYLVVGAPEGASPHAHHLELIQEPHAPFIEGNHLFASFSGEADMGRAPPGQRTVTVSTHVPLRALRDASPEERARLVSRLQQRMREGLEHLAPEWMRDVRHEMTGSPRTFERFTGRDGGAVGGVPRRAGLHHYVSMSPRPVLEGLWLVGDSVFPGQSTLATALGGVRTAARVAPRQSPAKRTPAAFASATSASTFWR